MKFTSIGNPSGHYECVRRGVKSTFLPLSRASVQALDVSTVYYIFFSKYAKILLDKLLGFIRVSNSSRSMKRLLTYTGKSTIIITA